LVNREFEKFENNLKN